MEKRKNRIHTDKMQRSWLPRSPFSVPAGAAVFLFLAIGLLACKKDKAGSLQLVPSGIDSPLLKALVFHPARSTRDSLKEFPALDIPVTDSISLGARFFLFNPSWPTVLLFHGNGEIADHYLRASGFFQKRKLNLLVFDFRGYGWSDGEPGIRSLTGDIPAILDSLGNIQKQFSLSGPLLVWGRSLGSISAVEMVYKKQELFSGLVLESGISDPLPLLKRFGYVASSNDPPLEEFSAPDKLKEIRIPVLILHGSEDRVVPVEHGMENGKAVPKNLLNLTIIEGAGHNDLPLFREEYGAGIDNYLNKLFK